MSDTERVLVLLKLYELATMREVREARATNDPRLHENFELLLERAHARQRSG